MKAAIVIDDWKLPIFKKILDDEGYIYSEHNGPTEGCLTLQIEADSIDKLHLIVLKMNQRAAISRMH